MIYQTPPPSSSHVRGEESFLVEREGWRRRKIACLGIEIFVSIISESGTWKMEREGGVGYDHSPSS